MKKLFMCLALFIATICIAQGKNISLSKKSQDPVTVSEKIINVGDIIFFQMGGNPDGSFRFVQDLNNFNEPIKQSASRTSMMKQPIKFFKEKDGVVYAFTKYFVANLEAAITSGEILIQKEKK